MDRSNIRVKTYAVLRRGGEILVHEVREVDGTLVGYRIPGGHVEFGEMSIDAVKREFMEEISAELTDLHPLPVIERTYFYRGKQGHEVIFPYLAKFADPALYQQDMFDAVEDNGDKFTLFWVGPAQNAANLPIFPEGLVDILDKCSE